MRIFGRDLARYLWRLPELPAYLGYLLRCFALFRRPLPFLWAYLRADALPGGVVELRDGTTIRLSGHPHDVISVFVIFVREDYGRVAPGSVVVDLGANLGIFALYAARQGAALVYAYEPGEEAYATLLDNVAANGLAGRVLPRRAAVVGEPGAPVRFPTRSSMYNRVLADGEAAEGWAWVETAGLAAIGAEAGRVDLLKVDVEGAEYELLLGAGEDFYSRVKRVRLEYHAGRVGELDRHLARFGLLRRRARADTSESGSLWYERGGGRRAGASAGRGPIPGTRRA